MPAIIVAYYLQDDLGRWLALAIFIAASITDFFDGYLARIWKMQSSIGRMLDPIADKLLVATSLMLLVSDNTIGGWSLLAAIVILTREISVSGLREFLAELRVSVPVTRLAKWKTTLQMVAIGFLLAGPAGDKVFPSVSTWARAWGSFPMSGSCCSGFRRSVTLYTGYDYFRAGIRHLLTEDHVKLVYFAWVRERIGVTDEDVALPDR